VNLLTFTFPGEPIPKGRPRKDRGHWHTPARTEKAENSIRWQLKAAHVTPTSEPVAVELHYRCKSHTADLDNLIKLTLDAATGYLWEDDRQVWQIIAEVERGSSNPETVISVTRVEQSLQRTCNNGGAA